VEESEAKVLLGVKISKNLTWTKQVEELMLELSRRVGIIRRLSHQMPRHTMMKVLTPIFTSTLQYAIKIFTDPSGAICEGRKQDSLLETLQISQNKAMRAALGRGSRDRSRTEELLALTGQPSVLEISLRAVMRAAKFDLGRYINEAPSCMAEGRICLAQDVQATRCNVQGILPPQDSSSTLVASMASVWNVMPSEIKEEEQEAKWKKKIKTLPAEKPHF
jgi:hypothetical protein